MILVVAKWVVNCKGGGKYCKVCEYEGLGEDGASKRVMLKESRSDFRDGAGVGNVGDDTEWVEVGKISIAVKGGIFHVKIVSDVGWDGSVGWF